MYHVSSLILAFEVCRQNCFEIGWINSAKSLGPEEHLFERVTSMTKMEQD